MDEEEFDRERLSIGQWPVEGEAWKHIDKASWSARADENSIITSKISLALHISPTRSFAAIVACGANSDQQSHVEVTQREGVIDYRPGVSWVVGRVIDICRAQKPACLVIDLAGQAGGMVDEIQAACPGLKIIHPNTREYAQGCGEFFSAVKPKRGETSTLVHMDQACLNSAVASVDTRKSSGMWCWDQETSGNDITTLIAATHALWGYKKHVHKATSAPFAVWR